MKLENKIKCPVIKSLNMLKYFLFFYRVNLKSKYPNDIDPNMIFKFIIGKLKMLNFFGKK